MTAHDPERTFAWCRALPEGWRYLTPLRREKQRCVRRSEARHLHEYFGMKYALPLNAADASSISRKSSVIRPNDPRILRALDMYLPNMHIY
jgi:hypothetical protein